MYVVTAINTNAFPPAHMQRTHFQKLWMHPLLFVYLKKFLMV